MVHWVNCQQVVSVTPPVSHFAILPAITPLTHPPLRAPWPTAILRTVQNLRLIPLLLAIALLSGCATSHTGNVSTRSLYRKVRVTDVEGHLIADWVSEGSVWPYGNGYRFKAVERVTGGPNPQLLTYPHGRKVIVNGPNIAIMPCGKPEWLYRIDGF
jgi:hypothetical protein